MLTTRREVSVISILCALAACAPVRGASSLQRGYGDDYAARANAVRERLPSIAEYAAESIPGFQVACILDGSVAWSEGFGVRTLGGPAVDSETIFDLGSLTKPVFATVVLRLAERGILDLNRPLADFDVEPETAADPRTSRVTARHVLIHQTGLPNWRSFAPGSPLEFIADPGSSFRYSGEGFFWLQRVVEDLLSLPIASIIRQEVFEPAGMNRAALTFDPSFAANYAQGHLATRDPGVDSWNKRNTERTRRTLASQGRDLDTTMTDDARAAAHLQDQDDSALPSPVLVPANAAGSLQTTAADYARFVTGYMQTGSVGLLSAESVNLALTPQTRLNSHISIGHGWRLEDASGQRTFWHSGFNEGFHSFALGDPDGRFGVVLLTNSNRGNRLRWPVVHGATGRGDAAMLS